MTIDQNKIVYMTSGCCEDTGHVHADMLTDMGLEFGSFNGDFYPLTDDEALYVRDDYVACGDGFGALIGYSVLFEKAKFLAPCVEFYFGTDDGSEVAGNAAELAEYGRAYSEDLRTRIEAIGGNVVFTENYDVDRHHLIIMIPFDYALATAKDSQSWTEHLESTLLRSDLKFVPGSASIKPS